MLSIGPSLLNAPVRHALRKVGLAVAAASCVVTASVVWSQHSAPQAGDSASSATVALSALPAQAQRTEQLIRRGGPFPYTKDGAVFGNRERLLPLKPRGHYREYTVQTPGSPDRGARRIVCGGERPVEPEACFYTADHYASFLRIAK